MNTERVGIGAREIGNGCSCYVVLEVGVNHGGHASGKTKCSIHNQHRHSSCKEDISYRFEIISGLFLINGIFTSVFEVSML